MISDYYGNIIKNREIQLSISIGYEDLKEWRNHPIGWKHQGCDVILFRSALISD